MPRAKSVTLSGADLILAQEWAYLWNNPTTDNWHRYLQLGDALALRLTGKTRKVRNGARQRCEPGN